MKLEIIYEDNHLIAVNKPAGVLVQGDETGDTPMADYVKMYIKDRYDKPGDVFLGVIHRIDRPVSGVVVFARTSKALARMNKLFEERKVEKTYWAIVQKRPDPLSAHLVHYMIKDRDRNIAKALDQPGKYGKEAKKAELDYELMLSIGDHHLLEVKPLTGRPHQIRAQLGKMGYPIRGDVKYGAQQGNKDGSIHLHCRSLSFIHPIKLTPVTITAEVPHDPLWRNFS